MTNINDGGPAFPVPMEKWSPNCPDAYFNVPDKGLTIRDYFAAKAMQGLVQACAGSILATVCGEQLYRQEAMGRLVHCAGEIADAMLAAREKEPAHDA